MPTTRTATQAGWAESRYNLCAWPPDGDDPIIANLYAGTLGKVSLLEYALLKSLDELPETHPVLERLAKRGLIVDFDERARIERQRMRIPTRQRQVRLTICPTMACNFDCPYCFETHRAGTMSEAVQDQVAALADRLLAASGADELSIVWYGGEPLLAPDVIKRLTRLLEAACSKHCAGIRASVITNGYLLDREMVRLLVGNRVKSARVTVDGMGSAHDATRHLAGGGVAFDPRHSFGDAGTWDPADPGSTTAFPENRTRFTHESLVAVNSDEECRECLWLPVCAGGCPKRRLAGQRECVFWKDDPEGFVLAQYANMGEKGHSTKAGPEAVGRVIAPVLRKFGVARAWVYGSFALGRANVHSDVDLIVEMPSGVNLGRSFFDLRRELKAALGRRVDLHLPPNAGARADYVRVLERTRVLVFDEGK